MYPRALKKSPRSLAVQKKSVTLHPVSACGEIGRRARLRIWYREMCRFESYQAHKETKRKYRKDTSSFCLFLLSAYNLEFINEVQVFRDATSILSAYIYASYQSMIITQTYI